MPPSTAIPADALLAHATCVRSLARSLLGDEHAAEDVLQETWMAALSNPPASRDGLGGWLNRVAQRLALKRRRGEARRVRREEVVAREERIASGVEEIEQRDALRRVVDAVLALDEPYRGVVLQRYYQDLTPSEIARERDVPVATVDSQLHRAKEQLRERLDREHAADGGRARWMGALAAATRYGQEAATTAVGSGATLGGMGMMWKLGLGAAAAAITWFSISSPAEESIGDPRVGEAAEVAHAGGGDLRATGAQDGTGATNADGSEREAVGAENARASSNATATGASNATTRAYDYTLRGLVVDEDDRPVAGVDLWIAPPLQPLNLVGKSARDGSFEITWSGTAASMPIVFYPSRVGVRGTLVRLEVHADGRAFVRAFVRRGPGNRLKAEIERIQLAARLPRQGEAGAEIAQADRKRLGELVKRYSRARSPEPLLDAERDASGRTGFVWPTPAEYESGFLVGVGGGSGMDGGTLGALKGLGYVGDSTSGLEGGLLPAASRPASRPTVRFTFHGTVTDEEGRPVEDALVVARGDRRMWLKRTDAEGRFEVLLEQDGAFVLTAGGGNLGFATRTVTPDAEDPPAEIAWDPILVREREVVGRLVDDAGTPLGGWCVYALAQERGARWTDADYSTDDGRFAIPNLGPGSVALLLQPDDFTPFAHQVVAAVPTGPEPRDVTVEPQAFQYGRARIEVVDETGDALPDAEVRLWQESTGRGAWMTWREDRFELGDLPAGSYRITAGTLDRGFVDAGTVWVAVDETNDLGRVTLPAPGVLTWSTTEAPDPSSERTWRLFRTAGEVWSRVTDGTLDAELADPLPAGDYALVLVEPGSVSAPVFATVQPGEGSSIDLGAGDVRHASVVFEAESGDQVRAIVEDEAGRPVTSFTSETGHAQRLLLRSGRYRVRAETDTGRTGTADFVVGEKETRTVVELR